MRAARIATGLLILWTASAFADGAAASHERLFRELGAEAVADRDEAARSLEKADELTEAEVRAALRSAPRVAKPHLLRLAAARGMKGLVPDIVASLRAEDPAVTDAAARALVSLGDDAAATGILAMAGAKGDAAASVRTHLVALTSQHMVERAVIGKWRRKGGTYEHRFDDLVKYGWPVQPVLLAMLLDVPLSDHDVVLPQTDDPDVLLAAKWAALGDIERSSRRGYRTFEPVPVQIERDELFDLAVQAMKDVADLELVGDILEHVSENLETVDELHGWRLRRFEESYYRDIDVALYARGRPERLERFTDRCREQVENAMAWLTRADEVGRGAEQRQLLSQALQDYASALHQLHKYDEAAACFAQIIRLTREQGNEKGKDPAIAGYNRACALNRGGRKDEALRQLDRALDRDRSVGWEDLTKDWVTEDGDLESLHSDPRFQAIIKRRFDEAAAVPADAGGSSSGGGESPMPPNPPPPPRPK
jgi:tetratricopeptide (TPR) repeat protein